MIKAWVGLGRGCEIPLPDSVGRGQFEPVQIIPSRHDRAGAVAVHPAGVRDERDATGELAQVVEMRGLEVMRPRFHFRAVATTQVALRDHRELREKIYGYREKVMSSKVTGR